MPTDKRCECDGIKLLVDLMDAYVLWGEKNPQYKEKARKTAVFLHRHLVEQAEKPGNEPLLAKVKDKLERQGHGLDMVKWGDMDPIGPEGLDRVRNDIHQIDELKQLMVCGGPYSSPDNLEDGAKVVKIALSLLAEPEPPCGMKSTDISARDAALMAREPLAGYAKMLEC